MENNTVHTITLSGYIATTDGNCWALQLGTWDSYGIEQIQLKLGKEWAGLVITATFTPPKGRKAVKVVVDSSGLFDVPQEATALSGQGTITFAGNTSGQQRISVDVPYVVANHAAVDGVTPDPTPSEWAQFVEQVQQARDDAEAAAQAAEGSNTAAAGSASDAANSAAAAAGSAQEAKNLVDGAVQDITDAKNAAVQEVQKAQSTGVQAVQEAQNTAVQAVQAAQTTAVGAVNDAGNAKIEQIEQINALVPTPTPEDAGKVIVVKPDGTGYELGDAGNEINDTVVAPDTTWSSLNIVNKLCPPFSVTGAAVQFSPVEGYPLSVQSTIVATQEGTGDPSPENVRPIVPVDEVGVWVGGKNLLNLEGREVITDAPFANTSVRELNGNKLYVGIAGTNYFANGNISDYSVNENSVFVKAVSNGYGLGFDVPVNPGMQITVSILQAAGTSLSVAFYSKSGKWLSYSSPQSGASVTVPSDCAWAVVILRPDVPSAPDGATYQNPQVEVGSAATAYEPYRGQLYTAQLPEPCYGGKVDLTGGTGEFDYFRVEISDPSTVYMGDGSAIFYTTLSLLGFADAKYNPAQNVASAKLFMCDRLKPVRNIGDTSPYGEVAIFENGIIRMKVEGVTSQQGARDWITANPVAIAYKLATPIPFTFAPLSIPAPTSPATAYSTAGEITVSGRSDPTVLIQQMQSRLAALESAQTGI